MPKIVFLNIYYPSFLDSHYERNPYLLDASYKEQLTSIQGTMFGDSDFYSHAFKELGWDAEDLITTATDFKNSGRRKIRRLGRIVLRY
jgi:hypothetical protein